MRPRVLVVDDNADNREYAREVLAEGYEVALAGSGSAALGLVSARSGGLPQLVLLDVSLPRRDGWSILAELRRDPETAALPVVACTAHAMSGDRERALRAGFDGYLSKPFRPAELLELVASFIGPGEPDPAAADAWSLNLEGE